MKENVFPILELAEKRGALFSFYLNKPFLSFLKENYSGYRSIILSCAEEKKSLDVIGGNPYEPIIPLWYWINLKSSQEQFNTELSHDFSGKQPKGFYFESIHNSGTLTKMQSGGNSCLFLDSQRVLNHGYSYPLEYTPCSFPFDQHSALTLFLYEELLMKEGEGAFGYEEPEEIVRRLEAISDGGEERVVTLPFYLHLYRKELTKEWLVTLLDLIEQSPKLRFNLPSRILSKREKDLPNLPSLVLPPQSFLERMEWLRADMSREKGISLPEHQALKTLYPGSEEEVISFYHEVRKHHREVTMLVNLKKKERSLDPNFDKTISMLQDKEYFSYTPSGGLYKRKLRHQFYSLLCKAVEVQQKKSEQNKNTLTAISNGIKGAKHNLGVCVQGGAIERFLDFTLKINYCANHQNYPEIFRPYLKKPRYAYGLFQDSFLEAESTVSEGLLTTDSPSLYNMASHLYSNPKGQRDTFTLDATIPFNEGEQKISIEKKFQNHRDLIAVEYLLTPHGPKPTSPFYFGVSNVISLPDFSQEMCQIYLYDKDGHQFALSSDGGKEFFEDIISFEINVKNGKRNRLARKKTYVWDKPANLLFEPIITRYWTTVRGWVEELQSLGFSTLFLIDTPHYAGEAERFTFQIKLGQA